MKAPIIIFTYNRLNHLKKLLFSLKKNSECKNSKVYFFIDGPKNKDDKLKTEKIFNYLKKINLFDSKKIFYRKKNLGSAKSILEGINYVSKKEKKFIVLEEDLIVSNEFLFFCNKALKLYENEKKVWHINCWVFKNLNFDQKYFLSTHMSCWGWATWSNRWRKLKKIEKNFIYSDVKKNFKKKFDFLNSGSCLSLLLNDKGKIDTWAVYWYYIIFKNKGLTITPFKTLVVNKGFDIKSTNTKINYFSNSKIIKKSINYELQRLKPVINNTLLGKINKMYNKTNFVLIFLNALKEFKETILK
tara:strand:- start:411 stop:1313 length:903 start_codon:yes stop_codon:yes gene_type:complete